MWYQLILERITPEETEALEDLLLENGALSVTYLDSEDEPILEPAPGETRLWQQSNLVALFDDEDLSESVKVMLQREYPSYPTSITHLEDEVWERAWQKGYEPMLFGERLCICPSHKTPPDSHRINVFMDPGLAFGSGTHQTTDLCLRYLEKTTLTDKVIADYGCGSGILAISALKLGAHKAFATDIDPQAVLSTQDNAKRNGIESELLEVVLPEDFSPPKVDILMANILAQPLILLKETFLELVKEKGQLVLSGILSTQSEQVQKAYACLFKLVDKETHDGWVRLTFEKG